MKTFNAIDLMDINENAIRLIGRDWMLITAGTLNKFNTMTASWGCLGYLWNKPVAFVFIRPQRYTFEFTEQCDTLTLSFFSEEYRKMLNICGSKSGRDTDKVQLAEITPIETSNGSVAFSEASLILEGTKIYTDVLKADLFIDKGIIPKMYPNADFHKIYVVELTKAWQK